MIIVIFITFVELSAIAVIGIWLVYQFFIGRAGAVGRHRRRVDGTCRGLRVWSGRHLSPRRPAPEVEARVAARLPLVPGTRRARRGSRRRATRAVRCRSHPFSMSLPIARESSPNPSPRPPRGSVSGRSPTTATRSAPATRRAQASIIGLCGFPMTSARRPDATSMETRIAPAPGQRPSGAGNAESSFVATKSAPDRTATLPGAWRRSRSPGPNPRLRGPPSGMPVDRPPRCPPMRGPP